MFWLLCEKTYYTFGLIILLFYVRYHAVYPSLPIYFFCASESDKVAEDSEWLRNGILQAQAYYICVN